MANRINDVESGFDEERRQNGQHGMELSARGDPNGYSARRSISDAAPDEVSGTDEIPHRQLRREWSNQLFNTNLKGFRQQPKVSNLFQIPNTFLSRFEALGLRFQVWSA